MLERTGAHHKARQISKSLILSVLLLGLYTCWMTGFALRFVEVDIFPNYNMLTRSFFKGQTYLEDSPSVDYLVFEGKKYLYFGPGPVVFHAPSILLASRGTPTGLVVVILMSAAVVVFHKILACLEYGLKPARAERFIFSSLFALNGFSLLMTAIPSIHHEAILSGMFFLLCGIYFVLRHIQGGSQVRVIGALGAGFCFLMAMLSRFSYCLSIVFLCSAFAANVFWGPTAASRKRTFLALSALASMILAGGVVTFWYNYVRFGSPFDFGVQYMASMYLDYFKAGHYFRYDHIPYNLWSYFFRLPEFKLQWPHLELPFYLLKVQSVQSDPYFLFHVNELSVSVFLLMPALVFCLCACFGRSEKDYRFQRRATGLLFVVTILQVAPLSLTVAATPRYYTDFLPLLLLLSYLGYLRIRQKIERGLPLLLGLAIISLTLSFSVILNGLPFYKSFIYFESPLLRLW